MNQSLIVLSDDIDASSQTLHDQANYEIAAANRALLRADAYCQNNASCPFHSDGRGSVPKVISPVLCEPRISH